jgi:hypothetical protein
MKALALKSISLVLGLLVGFIFFEIGLRLFPPDWLIQRMRELNAGNPANEFGSDTTWPAEKEQGRFVRFTPLTHFRVEHWEYNNIANIDRWGGRRVSPIKSGKNNTHVVPFLGDSFCFGVGVEDNQTYVSLLNSRNVDYEYLNLGVPGSALPQHLDIIESRHRELGSPQTYIFSFFLGNDFTDIVNAYEKHASESASPGRSLPQPSLSLDSILIKLNGYSHSLSLLRYSFLVQFVRQRIFLFRNRSKAEKLADTVFLAMGAEPGYDSQISNTLDLALSRLEEMSTRFGFGYAFIIIPDRHQVDSNLSKSKAEYYGFDLSRLQVELPNKMIEEKLQQKAIPYFDVTECLRDKADMYYVLDNHLTALGHQVVAECISTDLSQVVSSSLLKKSSN